MNVRFAFGKTGLELRLPDRYSYKLLEARSAAPLLNWQQTLIRALDAPIARPALEQLAAGKRSAAISVCDITRPAPNRLILPHVLERLNRAGIAREAVTILIATGLHRPATESEIVEIVGSEVAGSIRVVNHNARNLPEHRALGETQSGTPV